MHGDIGYKFCWLLLYEDHNQGTPAGHESNGTIIKDHWEDMNQLRHQLGMNQWPLLIHVIQSPDLLMTKNHSY